MGHGVKYKLCFLLFLWFFNKIYSQTRTGFLWKNNEEADIDIPSGKEKTKTFCPVDGNQRAGEKLNKK